MQADNSQKIVGIEKMKELWNNRAKDYEENEKLTFPLAVNLSNTLDMSKAKHILEVACGSGRFAIYFLKMFTNAETYISCDLSENMIQLAEQNKAQAEGLCKTTQHSFVTGNAEDLSFVKDESIDVYISNLGINFVPDTDKALQEAKRVLKKGGRIGLSVPVPEQGAIYQIIQSTFAEENKKISDVRSPYHLSSREKLIKLLKDNGFIVHYIWEDRFRFPYYNEEDLQNALFRESGPMISQLDEEGQKRFKEKVLTAFRNMKEDYIAPFMGALSIIAEKPRL